jgi:TP901 family phage tail tape measure protein
MAAAVFNAFQGPTLGAKGAMTELNVAIGLLGNAGIKGSDAGTSLKQALLQLTGPSNKSKDAMKALYIAAKDSGANEKLLAGITREGATERGKALDVADQAQQGARRVRPTSRTTRRPDAQPERHHRSWSRRARRT